MAPPSIFVLAMLAPGAQRSTSAIWHVAEMMGSRSEGAQDVKSKHSYFPNKSSLKIFQSLFFSPVRIEPYFWLKSESPEIKYWWYFFLA